MFASQVEVVSVEWVWECVANKRLVPCAAFRLKPFTGLHLCTSGLDMGACGHLRRATCRPSTLLPPPRRH